MGALPTVDVSTRNDPAFKAAEAVAIKNLTDQAKALYPFFKPAAPSSEDKDESKCGRGCKRETDSRLCCEPYDQIKNKHDQFLVCNERVRTMVEVISNDHRLFKLSDKHDDFSHLDGLGLTEEDKKAIILEFRDQFIVTATTKPAASKIAAASSSSSEEEDEEEQEEEEDE